jgi:secreted trypsin-like serine protease
MKHLLKYSLLVSLLLLLAACSSTAPKANEELDAQIVGGTQAVAHAYPFMVTYGFGPKDHYCGGSVLNNQWVLTAAHCVYGENASAFYVRAGDHRISVGGEGEQVRRAVKIIIHPDYDDYTADNDIALIKLSSPFTFNSLVQPVRHNTLPSAGTSLRVMGWGDQAEDAGDYPDALRQVDVPLRSEGSCSDAYGDEVTGNMFCAGLRRGGKDSCQGDSGGPILNRVNNTWQQVGIVSWGDGCAQPGRYGVYTKLQNYKNWISTTVQRN